MNLATSINKLALSLATLFLISAFAVIYLKDLNRRLFIEYESLQRQTQQSQVEWSKLLLEQSTLATQVRIQQIAQKRLGMIVPVSHDIVMVQAAGETLAEK